MGTLKIRPVTLCRAQAEKGVMTYMSYYGEKIWRPYLFWIIEGTGQNVLVDTAIHAHEYRDYHPGFQKLLFEPLSTFEEALKRFSLRPEEIDLVIQTHLHFDHCFNTSKCKNARVLVQEEELRFARDPHPLSSVLYDRSLFEGTNLEVVKGRKEILPGIEVIPVPGHSPGCQAVAVDTEAGKAVITGFCCIRENFYPPEDIRERVSPMAGYPVIIPGIHTDAHQAYESVLKVKELADILVPNHEPSLMDVDTIP
ncbi:MAG: N-acyl homoserine lactonase family protein [Pseudomonadota bacterium]